MGQSSKPDARPDHPIRVIVIEAEPHAKRGGRKGKTAGPGNKGLIVIATNLLDVPAEIIALIYRLPLGHRDLLPLLQADPGLPAPAEPAAGRDQDPGVLRDHRLPADQPLDRHATDETHRGDARLVLCRRGDGGGGAGVPRRPDNTGVKRRAKDELWKKLGY